jgi:hypothetical protein
MKIIIKESQFNRVILEAKMKDTDTFIKRAQDIHKDSKGNPLYDYSLTDYQGAQNKVKIICPRHKQEWKDETGNEYFEMTANHHLRGRGCNFDYLENKVKHSDKDIEDAAKKYTTAVEFIKGDFPKFNAAVKKGRKFYDDISTHFVAITQSYGEKLVSQILSNKGLIPKECVDDKNCGYREKIFENCTNQKEGRFCRKLRFDFYLPKQNAVIEYDGEQHFVKRGKFGEKFDSLKQNEIIKNKFCKDNNIKLIRIHYKSSPDEIERKLIDSLNSSEQEILIGAY